MCLLQDDEGAKRLEEIANQRRERIAARSSPSSPLATSTPRASEKQPSTPTAFPTLIPTPSLTPKPKPSAARRLSPSKKASPGAFRGTVSSPAAPATSASKLIRTSQRRLQSAPTNQEVENPMSRSVPSLAELRKENTKPSLVRTSTYNERPRSTGSKLPGIRGASAPLEANGSRTGSRGVSADDKKRQLSTRKSVAAVTESVPEAPAVAPPKSSKALPAEASATSKSNKRLSLPSATSGDSKSSLRKGRGIGPGSGPNVRKSKVAAAPDPSKEEDTEKSISLSEHEPVKAEGDAAEEDVMGLMSSVEEDKGASVRADPIQATEVSNVDSSSVLTAPPSTSPQTLAMVLDDDYEMIRLEEWQEPELAEDVRRPEEVPSSKTDQYAIHAEVVSESLHSSTLRHFLQEDSENVPVMDTAASGTVTPPQRSSPIHLNPLRSSSPKGSEVPDLFTGPRAVPDGVGSSSQVRYEAPYASFAGVSSSPAMSPAPLQLQLSLSPEAQISSKLRKKWLGSQKVLAPPPVKESPRGLKRLLKFGMKKKDKSSAASTTSDSPSDIDDDMDFAIEHGGRTGELTHIGAKSLGSRMAGKASDLVGPPAIPEDSATEGDAGDRLVSSKHCCVFHFMLMLMWLQCGEM